MNKLIYLATPYSHADKNIQKQRFENVNKVAAKMMMNGLHIFSPISHTHPIAEAGDLPRGWDFWHSYDRTMLNNCFKLVVLMQDGWEKSVGVSGEIEIAKELGIEIEYLEHK